MPPKVQRIAQNLVLNALQCHAHGGVRVQWAERSVPGRAMAAVRAGHRPGLPGRNPSRRPWSAHCDRRPRRRTRARARRGRCQPGKRHRSRTDAALAVRSRHGSRHRGEGIGLSIVKRLCELLDASLELETAPGAGTTFRVIFPRAYPRPAAGSCRCCRRQAALRVPVRASKLTARCVLCLLLAGAAIAAAAPLRSVQDDLGRAVLVPGAPLRIVSLTPGATEMLFAAGAGAQLIATVEYSDEPPAARRIPRIGDVAAVDMERLVALRPDVVVAWPAGGNPAQRAEDCRARHCHLPAAGGAAGGPAALTAPPGRARRAPRRLPSAPRALSSSASRRCARAYAAGACGRRQRPSVLLQVWNRPIYTVGGRHLMSDALELCGARNVFARSARGGPGGGHRGGHRAQSRHHSRGGAARGGRGLGRRLAALRQSRRRAASIAWWRSRIRR